MVKVFFTLFFAVALTLAAPVQAQTYPTRPVRMIVPLPPGGASDVIARLIAHKLAEAWGQNVIVDNRGGGGMVIGTNAVAHAAPDGYTFGLVVSSFTIDPNFRRDLPYDVLKDFTPLSLLGFNVIALVATPSLPASDVAGLTEAAKRTPGGLSYASLGMGTSTHLAGELLKASTGIEFVHVPYAGSAPAYGDLLPGRVPVGFVTLQSALPHLRSGALKMIGTTNEKRSPAYSEYPTIGETLPGYAMGSMFGFVGPAKLPPAIAAKLSADLARAIRAPELQPRFSEFAVDVVGSTPEEFDAFIRADIAKWAPIVKASGAKVE
jgi:tripartite-type tricarboxylate transporter receptor subunit TctC